MDVNEIAVTLQNNPMLYDLMKLAIEINDHDAIKEATCKLQEANDGKKEKD